MAEGGEILSFILKKTGEQVKPGVTTEELNDFAERLIKEKKVKPSFKNYQDFPCALCTSVNEEVVHTVPSSRSLKDGDIISLDLGVLYQGYHTDMAITLPVGDVNPETLRLIKATKKALKRGIKKVRPNNTFGDLGNTIQRYVEGQGFNVVRDLCGHGIGKEIHEDPQILNYGKRHSGLKISEGMVFCLEPMVTMGDWKLKKRGYGFVTKDDSLSAHFEQTMVVTKKGCRVLTEF